MYTPSLDGGIVSRRTVHVGEAVGNFAIASAFPGSDPESVRIVGILDVDTDPSDPNDPNGVVTEPFFAEVFADGGATARNLQLDTSGEFPVPSQGIAVAGGSWISGGCIDMGGPPCTNASGGSFFLADDASVPPALVRRNFNIVHPSAIAQNDAGSILVAGSGNSTLYFSLNSGTTPLTAMASDDEIEELFLTSDPSNPTGFVAVVTVGASPTTLYILSLDGEGAPVNGGLAHSWSAAETNATDDGGTAGTLALQGAAVDGNFLYIALAIRASASAPMTWVLRRYVYDRAAIRWEVVSSSRVFRIARPFSPRPLIAALAAPSSKVRARSMLRCVMSLASPRKQRARPDGSIFATLHGNE